MSELERRALLGAVGVGALAALSKAGPIDPPAGPVGSTGRTLDEVYDKIPVLPNGTSDGRVQIPGGTSLVSIMQPGNYVLTGDISTGATGIYINGNNVDLDLNGFRITSTALGTGVGPIVFGLCNNVAVRNGWLLGGPYGVYSGFNTSGMLLENLRIVGARFNGINVVPFASRAWQIRRCHVLDTGDTGSNPAGLRIAATGVVIEDTVVHGLRSSAGSPVYHGIEFVNTSGATGNLITRCVVSNDAPLPAGSVGVVSAGSLASRDNTVMNFATGYQVAGPLANGGGNI